MFKASTKLAAVVVLVGTALLCGCAALNTLHTEVATFGDWPAARKAGTYAIERMPSQQARADRQEQLEAAARPALEAAGFKAAEAGQEPDFVVQLGARVTRTELSPWDDPLWWRGGFGRWRPGPWGGPRWGMFGPGLGYHDTLRYEREAALLVRERASGKPVYEARASSDGSTAGGASVLRAMYAAALKDFPATGPNPRQVAVPLVP